MRAFITFLTALLLGTLLPGCSISGGWAAPLQADSQPDVHVDFTDPVLNNRQILLFGSIDRRAAEVAIQKLLYLDSRSHDPIDLYLQTPGGEMRDAFAIEETMRLVHSPVNTYALSECNSGGAVLLAAGTGKRRAFHGAVIVIHGMEIHGRPPAGFTERLQDTYTDFWRKRTRVPPAWLPLPFGIKHILSAEQALEFGLVDEIIDK